MTGTFPLNVEFSLTDYNRRNVNISSFAGKLILVFFGFTNCKVVCPRMLTKLSLALGLLGNRAKHVQPLYITVDPARDTPDAMKGFLQHNFPRFLGLTGSEDEISAAKKSFKVFAEPARRSDDCSDYDVPHTAFIYIIDREGKYITHLGAAVDERKIADVLENALN